MCQAEHGIDKLDVNTAIIIIIIIIIWGNMFVKTLIYFSFHFTLRDMRYLSFLHLIMFHDTIVDFDCDRLFIYKYLYYCRITCLTLVKQSNRNRCQENSGVHSLPNHCLL